MDSSININLLTGCILEALRETRKGIYLRPYARRVAALAAKKYDAKMERRLRYDPRRTNS